MNFLTAAANPAGGAATQDIVLATGGAVVLTTLVVVTGVLYRSGQVKWLHKLAGYSERQWGVPAWVALPGEVASVSLIVALLGMYWDISLHIDQGRDPGPLANPAHYLILFGLFGVFVSGFLAIIMGDHRGGSSMIKRASTWKIPIGGILLFACASFSLLGFPLDDGWHRIFGQDVTLWGPTHLMLFGGAGMTLIGRASLLVEGQRAARRERAASKGNGDGTGSGEVKTGLPGRRLMNFQIAGLMGGFLIGMSTFQGEFDFGVPQFQLVFQPMLIAWAAGIALVTARIWGGRWSALVAVGFFIVIRGIVTIFVSPIMGEATPHFPLYIVEGVLVEAIAFFISTRKPIRFGVVSGLAIGTIGFAAEWAWSHIWMPLPWPSSLMPEGLIWAIVGGIAGGLLGALIGSALGSDRQPFPRRGVIPALVVAFVAMLAMVGYGLKTDNTGNGATAAFNLHNVDGGPGRYVEGRVTLNPPTAAQGKKWLTITAWQGGGLVVDRLKQVGKGIYQTTKPIPVNGDWKALLRLHKGNSLLGTPIYLPNDPAIPAKGVPTKQQMTRPIGSDHHILQREAKSTSGLLPKLAYGAVLAIALALCALMGWGLARLARDGDAGIGDAQPTPGKAWIQRPTGTREPTTA